MGKLKNSRPAISVGGFVFFVAAIYAPSLHATISVASFSSSIPSPQPVGSTVTFTATATDTNPGPLAFRYSIAFGNGPSSVVSDFNQGTLSAGVWTAPSFPWTTILGEGVYSIQLTAKDFVSGESSTTSAAFTLTPISTGANFVVTPTSNPLVGLASAPPCALGSSFQITIQQVGGKTTTTSDPIPCTPQSTMNVYAAGMLASTQYTINYQVLTRNAVSSGSNPATFTTGALPAGIWFPSFANVVPAGPQTDQADQMVLHSFIADFNTNFLPVATDRSGNILWYYFTVEQQSSGILTRALVGGHMLTLQSGNGWSPYIAAAGQLLIEIDLAGNIVRETNVGVLQQQLLAVGATDLGPCGAVPIPAPVGAACLGSMHHDAIRLPNGYTAVIVSVEKIFPPGTQQDTTGLNVDVIGDGVLVLDQNFQLVWYFDTFQHDSGAPQLDINRPAILYEDCAPGGCPQLCLVGTTGVTPLAHDWLHQNSLFFNPVDGDFIVSVRHQDWIYKIDYRNGSGTGNILWLMGPGGSFTFNNIYNDPYPWFSHQHDAEFANTATGLLTVFDNGNTRIAPPPFGLGTGNSRGMALSVDESTMTVTPVISQDLGYFSYALGSAQIISNGNYSFQPGDVGLSPTSYAMELQPTSGTPNATVVFSQQSVYSYRELDHTKPVRTFICSACPADVRDRMCTSAASQSQFGRRHADIQALPGGQRAHIERSLLAAESMKPDLPNNLEPHS